jgi:ligand-binding sensor domain-containing protein
LRFFFFIFIFTGYHSFIFSQELAWKNLPINKELPSSEVYQVLQDKKGFMWFATDAGVCRYDGEKISTFTSKEGLYENVILGLYEDAKGRIWFRGLSGSLSFYQNGSISAIRANKILYNILKPNGVITSLFVASGDTLYCATNHSVGLIKIAPQNTYEKVYTEKFRNAGVFILQNKKGNGIIYGCNHMPSDTSFCYVSRVNTPTRMLPSQKKLSGIYFKYITEHQGTLYIPEKMNLVTLSGQSFTSTKFPTAVFYVYIDRYNNLWIGFYKQGLLMYKNCDLSSKPLHFLKKYSVSSVFLDRENSLWVTTLEKGIKQALNINILLAEDEDDIRVGCFFRDDTLLYVGLNTQSKILKASPSKGIISEQTLNTGESSDLMGITRLADKWVFGSSYGVLTAASLNGKIKNVDSKLYAKVTLGLNDSTVAFISHSALVISDMNKRHKLFSIPDYGICITQTAGKKILVGTNKMGILEFKDSSFVPFPAKQQLHTRINFLGENKKRELWVGTNEEGVFIFRGQETINLSEKDGLASHKINDIAFDDKGCAWVATNKGLSKVFYDPSQERYRVISFYEADGLPSNEIIKIAFVKNSLFCAPRYGLFYVKPDDLVKNTVPPGISIEAATINGKSWNYLEGTRLKYNENNFRIILNRLSYKGDGPYNFMYKLQGFDTAFYRTAYSHINYTNLAPGTYTFIAYALNSSGVASTRPISFVFSIDKPLWLRWWFIITEGLVFILLMYVAIRYRLNVLQKRIQEKNEFKRRLVEYRLNALQAQMNPHFVFNAINSIQHFILSNKVEPAYHYLAQFAHLIRLVLSNSKQKSISLELEIKTLTLYIELESIRFSAPFTYNIQVDENLDVEDIYIVPMLIQPFVENAIKHGLMPKKDNAHLQIDFNLRDTFLYISITDNGIGRDASQKNKKEHVHLSTAISNTQERAQLMSEYAGEKAAIHIIDLYDTDQKPCGTKVEVIIPIVLN